MATVSPNPAMVPTLVKADTVSKAPTVTVVEVPQQPPKKIPVAPPGFKFVKVKKPDGTIAIVKRPLSAPGTPVTATGTPIPPPAKQHEAIPKLAGAADLEASQDKASPAVGSNANPNVATTTDGNNKLAQVEKDGANTATKDSIPTTFLTSPSPGPDNKAFASLADPKVTKGDKPGCKPDETVNTTAKTKIDDKPANDAVTKPPADIISANKDEPIHAASKTSTSVLPTASPTTTSTTAPPTPFKPNASVSAVTADVLGQSVLTVVKGATAHWFPEVLVAGAAAADAVAVDKKLEADKKGDQKPSDGAKSDIDKDKQPDADKNNISSTAGTEKTLDSNTVANAQKVGFSTTKQQSLSVAMTNQALPHTKVQSPAVTMAQAQNLAQAKSKTGVNPKPVDHDCAESVGTAIRRPPPTGVLPSRPRVQHVQQVVVASQPGSTVRTQPIPRVPNQLTTPPQGRQAKPTIQSVQTLVHAQTIQVPSSNSGSMQCPRVAAAAQSTTPARQSSSQNTNQNQGQSRTPIRYAPNGNSPQTRGPPQGSQAPGKTQQVVQQHLQALAFDPTTSGLANVGTGLGSHLMQSKSVGAAAAGLTLVGSTTLLQKHVLNQPSQVGSRPGPGNSQPPAHNQNVPNPTTGPPKSQISLTPPMTRSTLLDSHDHAETKSHDSNDQSSHDANSRDIGDHDDPNGDTSMHQGDDEEMGVWEPGDDEDINDMADSHDGLTDLVTQQHNDDLDDDFTPYDPDLDEGVHYSADGQMNDYGDDYGDNHTIAAGDQDVSEQPEHNDEEEHVEEYQNGDEPFDDGEYQDDEDNMELYQEGDVSYEPEEGQHQDEEHLDGYQDGDMLYEPDGENHGDILDGDNPWNESGDGLYGDLQQQDDTQEVQYDQIQQDDLEHQNDQHDYTVEADEDYYQDDAGDEQYPEDDGDY